MKYAIISDIHGNLTALETVLSDIKSRNIDRIICIGDIISKGCHAHECLELVKMNADAIVVGNGDLKYIKGLEEIAAEEDLDFDSFYFNQRQLSAKDISFIKKLPMCCEFYLSNCLIRCFHASPEDNNKVIVGYDNLRDKIKQFEPTKYTSDKMADIVVFGHVHEQHMECVFGRRLINAGSVGNSISFISDDKYNTKAKNLVSTAQYVVIDGKDGNISSGIDIQFVLVEYDADKELADFKFDKEKQVYERELKEGKYRHPERIAKKLNSLGVNVR